MWRGKRNVLILAGIIGLITSTLIVIAVSKHSQGEKVQTVVAKKPIKIDVPHGLPDIIPDGMRAMTVPISPVTGVAGFLKPSDRVDVIGILESNGTTRSKCLVQDVELLAVGSTVNTDQRHPNAIKAETRNDTATLLVKMPKTLDIALALNRGEKIYLVLRGHGDINYVAAKEVSDSQPFRQPEPLRAASPATMPLKNTGLNPWRPVTTSNITKSTKTIQIVRGSTATTTEVAN